MTAVVLAVAGAAHAQGTDVVEVRDAWIRGVIGGQKGTGAFMNITSRVPGRLVAVSSPVAGVAEIHNMTMEAGVMRMFAVDGVDLPANRTVRLAPGGYHVMLMELKRPLKPGERVPLNLTLEFAGGKRQTLRLDAEVRPLTGEQRHHGAH